MPPKYNKPRLVVNGALLNQPLMPTFPSQINSKWYFPIKPVVEFLGGSESVSGNNETLSLIVQNYDWIRHNLVRRQSPYCCLNQCQHQSNAGQGPDLTLPDSVIVDSSKNFLISADDMNTLFGFTWKYDSDWDILFLINPDTNN